VVATSLPGLEVAEMAKDQLSFDFETRTAKSRVIRVTDPTVETETKVRLSKKCLEVLAMLRQGEVTNVELAQVALDYRGRIRDLRAAGFHIECFDKQSKTGVTRYKLMEG
jgi:hypothetical protein